MSLDGRVVLMSTGGYLPLESAMWCADCESLFQSGVDQCPACASKEIYPLSTFLSRKEDE